MTDNQPEALRLADELLSPAILYTHDRAQIAAELRRLHAENEALRDDAKRYRWLREQMLGVDFDWNESGITALYFEMPDGCAYGGDCDRNIDAAMKGQP